VALRKFQGDYSSVWHSPNQPPRRCPWGEKASVAYLGPDRTKLSAWIACELIASARSGCRC